MSISRVNIMAAMLKSADVAFIFAKTKSNKRQNFIKVCIIFGYKDLEMYQRLVEVIRNKFSAKWRRSCK